MSDEKKDLGDMAGDAFDDAKDTAKQAADKAGDAFDDAKEKASEFADDAKEKASEFADSAKETANEFKEGLNNALGGSSDNKKVIAGVLAILIGALGVHKFVLGYKKEGIIMLLATVLTCGMAGAITGIIGLVEGIIYLTKSDDEFYNTYQENKKTWF